MQLNLKESCLNIFNHFPENLKSQGHKINLKRNQVLYKKGDNPPKGFYFIQTGLIALTDLSPSGNESLLRVHGDSFFLGHRSFLANENYHATALALENSELFFISVDNIDQFIIDYPQVFKHLTIMLARDLRIAEERINDLTGKRAKSRVIDTILFLKRRDPHYSWTRREIGEFSGTKTETVTRIITELEGLGLVVKNGRLLSIPDSERLLDHRNESDFES